MGCADVRSEHRVVYLAAALCACWLTPGRAGAQSLALRSSAKAPARTDDGASGSGLPRPGALFTPLRLALLSGLFPTQGVYSVCGSREGASGNSLNGFALERYRALSVFPRLSLHGFSSAGCPLDSGLGAGVSYAVPLGRSLWLVPSGGLYAQPGPDRLSAAVVSTSARVDVVKQLAWGRTLTLGLGTRMRSGSKQFPALNFGGSF